MTTYTDVLNLLKKDSILDATDTFNIDTMLNDNWDKIDEKFKEKIFDKENFGLRINKETDNIEYFNTDLEEWIEVKSGSGDEGKPFQSHKISMVAESDLQKKFKINLKGFNPATDFYLVFQNRTFLESGDFSITVNTNQLDYDLTLTEGVKIGTAISMIIIKGSVIVGSILDIPNASLTERGLVALTNELGDSEELAITQKALNDYAKEKGLGAVKRYTNNDFNNFKENGYYYTYGNATTMLNSPPSATSSGFLTVTSNLNDGEPLGGDVTMHVGRQEFTHYSTNYTFSRVFKGDEWSEWKGHNNDFTDRGTLLADGTDLNEFFSLGVYYTPTWAKTQTILNIPETTGINTPKTGIRLTVKDGNGETCSQELELISGLSSGSKHSSVWKRFYNGAWTEWHIAPLIIPSTLLTNEKHSITGAINEVFQAGNNVKKNTVNALLSVSSKLPITTTSSWDAVVKSIPSITVSSMGGVGFFKQTLPLLKSDAIIITLPFVPSMIVVEMESLQTNGAWGTYVYTNTENAKNSSRNVDIEKSKTIGVKGYSNGTLAGTVAMACSLNSNVFTLKTLDSEFLYYGAEAVVYAYK